MELVQLMYPQEDLIIEVISAEKTLVGTDSEAHEGARSILGACREDAAKMEGLTQWIRGDRAVLLGNDDYNALLRDPASLPFRWNRQLWLLPSSGDFQELKNACLLSVPHETHSGAASKFLHAAELWNPKPGEWEAYQNLTTGVDAPIHQFATLPLPYIGQDEDLLATFRISRKRLAALTKCKSILKSRTIFEPSSTSKTDFLNNEDANWASCCGDSGGLPFLEARERCFGWDADGNPLPSIAL